MLKPFYMLEIPIELTKEIKYGKFGEKKECHYVDCNGDKAIIIKETKSNRRIFNGKL